MTVATSTNMGRVLQVDILQGMEGNHRTTHKFGIELPKTVRRALELDREETGTTLWRDALQKEMEMVMKVFHTVSEDTSDPRYWLYCHRYHIKWDIEQVTLKRKARLVGPAGTPMESYERTAESHASMESASVPVSEPSSDEECEKKIAEPKQEPKQGLGNSKKARTSNKSEAKAGKDATSQEPNATINQMMCVD